MRKLLLVLILLMGFFYMSWGITSVNPRTVVPDTTASTTNALLRLHSGSPFRTSFRKGGNLHVHILSLIFWPKYNEVVKKPNTDELEQKVTAAAEHISAFLLRARILSLVAGMIGLLFVIQLSHLLFGTTAGLLGGIMVSTNLLFVHDAHRGTEDMLSTALLIVCLYFMARYLSNKSSVNLTVAALTAGLATSAKATAGILVIPLAYLVLKQNKDCKERLKLILGLYCWMGLAYLATTPSIMVYPQEFVDGIWSELSNRWAYKGFEATYPGWIIHGLNLARAFSLPLFVVVILTSFIPWYYGEQGKDFIKLSASILVPYFLFIGTWDNVNPDYVLPMIPILCVLSSGGIAILLDKTNYSLPLLTIIGITFFFSSWYTAKAIEPFPRDSRLLAQQYMIQNLGEGTSVDVYSYKQYLPRIPEKATLHQFPVMGRPDSDWEKAKKRLREKKPDYIVMVSAHYSRYLKNPNRYPEVTKTFKQLLKNRLGYRAIRQFGKELVLNYTLGTYLKWTWSPRPLNPLNPTVLIMKRV